MNTKQIISSLLAASLLTSTFAFARDYRYDNDQPQAAEIIPQANGQNFNFQYDQNDAPLIAQAGWYDNRRIRDNPGYERRYHRMNRGQERMIMGRDHFDHGWRRGQVMPARFMADRYVVNDWRAYRLSEPPRGYRWVHYNGDFVLAAIATGIITQIILNNRH